jgi:hypothetical protein
MPTDSRNLPRGSGLGRDDGLRDRLGERRTEADAQPVSEASQGCQASPKNR